MYSKNWEKIAKSLVFRPLSFFFKWPSFYFPIAALPFRVYLFFKWSLFNKSEEMEWSNCLINQDGKVVVIPSFLFGCSRMSGS